MDIAGLGTMNMDDYRFKSSSARATAQDFKEVLERARAADEALLETGVFIGIETDPVRTGTSVDPQSRSLRTRQIDKTDKLYEVCLELETFLVKNILTGMRNTVQKSGLVDDSFAGKMYEDMLYDEYAKDFTRGANFGLAEMAYRQLKNWGA